MKKVMVPKAGKRTIEDYILSEYAICPDCESSYLVIERIATKYWRGWQIVCRDCDQLVAEVDIPENPIDPRYL